MTKRRRMLAWAVAALALPMLPRAASAQQLYWYDGQTRRPLWAEPGEVARFPAAPEAKSQVLRPTALDKDDGAPRSPVFRDGPGEASRRRALPGGVILTFRPGTDSAQREALLARHGLTARRQIGEVPGRWLIEAPAGLPSLELANRLHESGDFAAATPNWWQQRTLK